MKKEQDKIYSDVTFWKPFENDLNNARGRVIIQSPFLSTKRISYFIDPFRRLRANDVTVCTFVQELRYNKSSLDQPTVFRLKEFQSNVALLKSEGIHVNINKGIHEKLAIIDSSIFWEGSLNILSHSNSKERMRRWNTKNEVVKAITMHGLDKCETCAAQFKFVYGQSLHENCEDILIQNLTLRRVTLGLKQRELANRLGISQSKISRLEKIVGEPPLKLVHSVARELGFNVMLVPDHLVPSVTSLLFQALSQKQDQSTQ